MRQAQQTNGQGKRRPTNTAPDNGPLADAMLQVVQRISQVLLEEKGLISELEFSSIDTLVARKSHLALELSRLMEHAQDTMQSCAVAHAIELLKAELTENAKLLRRHMDAMGEISALVAGAIDSASADGTYSSRIAHSEPKPWSR